VERRLAPELGVVDSDPDIFTEELVCVIILNNFSILTFQFFSHLMIKPNIYSFRNSATGVEYFIPEYFVTGVLKSATSVICGGIFRYFLPQCIQQHCC
jgi:hypothetical protein